MTTPVAPWSTMKTLFDKFSWEEIFPSMESYINGIVMNGFIEGSLGSWQFVQAGDLIFLIASFVSAACVILAAVDAGIQLDRAFYSTYANKSSTGNLIYLWEVILIIAWEFWAFFYLILALVFASNVW